MQSSSSSTTMSPGDFARLDTLEQQIATAWDQAALAWSEIKTAKLYRTTREGKSQTWEQYCQRVHGITPQWANKLISRADILQSLNAESETPVSLSPTAVGHLEGLTPHEQAEIVKSVTKDGQKPKAKDVAKARAKTLKRQEVTPGGPANGAGKNEGRQDEDDKANHPNGTDRTGNQQHTKKPVVGQQTAEGLAEELEGIAQRLSEINQDEFGKIHWQKAAIRKAMNAVAAVRSNAIAINRRLINEDVA